MRDRGGGRLRCREQGGLISGLWCGEGPPSAQKMLNLKKERKVKKRKGNEGNQVKKRKKKRERERRRNRSKRTQMREIEAKKKKENFVFSNGFFRSSRRRLRRRGSAFFVLGVRAQAAAR